MAMFSMFLNAPPTGTPAASVYFEQRPFGPFGQAAGESSTETGFSDLLRLQVGSGAPPLQKVLRAAWNGWLRVVGVQDGFTDGDPTAPVVVEIVPGPNEARELQHICAGQRIETPRLIRYHGVDPDSLVAAMSDYFRRADKLRAMTPAQPGTFVPNFEQLISLFRLGNVTVPLTEAGVAAGQPLGRVSTRNLKDGRIGFGIELPTDPPTGTDLEVNRLDPTTFFAVLTTAKLVNGIDAIDPAQRQNSWLDTVNRSRVLITFRDEWNAPLVSGSSAQITGPAAGSGQSTSAQLTAAQAGTVVAPTGWHLYNCSVGLVGAVRKLTQQNVNTATADSVTIDTAGPAHRVVASVRPEDWFQPTFPAHPPAPGADLAQYTNGNVVNLLVDGIPAFKQLVSDLRELNDSAAPHGRFPDNFVLIGGWFLNIDFEMIPGDSTTWLRRLLLGGVRSNHKLIVRALVWSRNVPDSDTSSTNIINSLDTHNDGYTRAMPVGFSSLINAFHWKVTVVRNRFGTFASLGGIDINPNRLDDSDHRPDKTHYHDVHCRIQGPAVADVTRAHLARWRIHVTENATNAAVTSAITPTVETPPEVPATHLVQITRTFRAGTGSGSQPWAPDGERTTWANLKNAIARARRYIYIEDQYFVAAMVRDEILHRLAQPDAAGLEVVIIIPDSTDSSDTLLDPVQNKDAWDRVRYLTLAPLMADHRVTVMSVKDYYVHTKVTVVDDIFCTIGSANINRRGLTFDAEINAWVLDGRTEAGARKFARDLRTRLWAEHLGLPLNAGTFARLGDIGRALDVLKNSRPSNSRMAPYQLRNPGFDYPPLWDSVVDPDGSIS